MPLQQVCLEDPRGLNHVARDHWALSLRSRLCRGQINILRVLLGKKTSDRLCARQVVRDFPVLRHMFWTE